MTYSKILPRLYVGSGPCGLADVQSVKEELGVTAVLNLQTDDDFQARPLAPVHLESIYRGYGMEMRRLPIQDVDPDDLREKLPAAASLLWELLETGHVVFVHCAAGVGRAPSVVVAYLHWFRGWRLRAAERHVQRSHPCMPNVQAIQLARSATNTRLRLFSGTSHGRHIGSATSAEMDYDSSSPKGSS